MSKNNGGPAFPRPLSESSITESFEDAQDGMTLRDYFAAKAMQIMWDAYDKGYCGLNNQDEPNAAIIASGAYAMADAMLSAREKVGE